MILSLFAGCESTSVKEPNAAVSTAGKTKTTVTTTTNITQTVTNSAPHEVYNVGQTTPVTSANKAYTPPPAKSRPKKATDQSGSKAVGLRTAKPGYVISPYAVYDEPIDVSGLPSGTEVKCPYSGKIFIIP
ncbi:MAG: hypothetical protein SGI98_06690 [Verrucomicrobiota bacterium]|nr:hypothetical protein [Verrucomicrobiota bacterium]